MLKLSRAPTSSARTATGTAVSRLRSQARPAIVILLGAGILVGVTAARWAGHTVSAVTLSNAVIAGITLGAIYSLAGVGLVVTYTTSGIFNFAQGAIGMLMAYLFWQFSEGWGLPRAVVLVLVVLVIAPLFGFFLDRFAFSRAAQSTLVVQLMATVALMVFLMGIAAWIWDPTEIRTVPFFFGTSGFRIGNTFVLWHRAITIALGVAIAIALRVVLHRSRIGLAMRAVVDNRELAALHGARPARASAIAWAIGSALAALAGILIAPEINMGVDILTLLIINAFAAAIIGRLRSLPLTVAGGLLIGLLTSFTLGFLDTTGRWANVPQAIPTIVLFIALLALPAAPLVVGRVQARIHARVPAIWEAVVGGAVIFVAMWLVSGWLGVTTVNRLTSGLVIALLLAPLVPLIGWAGQVALAPLAFGGLGAFAVVEFGVNGSWLGLLFAALIAIPFAVAIGLPALRLQGLYLALATVAFARGVELLFFGQPDILGNRTEVVQRPELFGLSFDSSRGFLLLVSVVFALYAVVLIALRRSTLGRQLIALRDSEAACTTIGLDVRRIKLMVFVVAGCMSAIAGGLLAMQRGTPTATDFSMFGGITLVLYLVLGGVTLISGALFAGWMQFVIAAVNAAWRGAFISALGRIAPGGLAAMVSQNPNGIAGEIAKGWAPRLPWRADARVAAAQARRRARGVDPKLLGVTEPFTDEEVRRIDKRLGVPPDLRRFAEA